MKKYLLFFIVALSFVFCSCSGANQPSSSTTIVDETDDHRVTNNRKITLSVENMSNVVVDGDNTYFNLVSNDKQTYKMYGYKISVQDSKIRIPSGSYIMSLDRIGGIYSLDYKVDSIDEWDDFLLYYHGYNFANEKVNSIADIYSKAGDFLNISEVTDHRVGLSDYIVLKNQGELSNAQGVSIFESVTFTYTGGETYIDYIEFNTDFYSKYVDGDTYRDQDELGTFGEGGNYTFYLVEYLKNTIAPSIHLEEQPTKIIGTLPDYEILNLKNKKGDIVSKDSSVYRGYSIEVKLYGTVFDVKLPFVDVSYDKESYYALNTDLITNANGPINTIVIPVSFNDLSSRENEETLSKIQSILGRVSDGVGNVIDYSAGLDNHLSLSSYFAQASNNKCNITSFISDYYRIDGDFYDLSGYNVGAYINDIMTWFDTKYSGYDLTQFDLDNNGYYDSVIFLNLGDLSTASATSRASFTGGYVIRNDNHYSKVITYTNIGFSNLTTSGHFDGTLFADTLIHEFGHVLGLTDYYDNSYAGLSWLGKYDMQDSNAGDWNPYSKYSVGWIKPIEINDDFMEGKNSKTITIQSFNTSGDVLMIRADESTTPFGEYIMIDLFDGGAGLNQYYASEYDLENAVGVRVLHIDSVLGDDGPVNVNYGGEWSPKSKYLIELIQAGKEVTFIDGTRRILDESDLFGVGSTFDASEYTNYFYNGLMDNGYEIPYIIHIDSITTLESGEHTVTITITKK